MWRYEPSSRFLPSGLFPRCLGKVLSSSVLCSQQGRVFDSHTPATCGIAGASENREGAPLLEKVHPCAAPIAGGPLHGGKALMTRYELAAAHEA
jgi:hypothetical protein